MKKITLLIIIIQICAASAVMAQLEGKRFISGGIGANFSNNNPDLSEATSNYSANVNIGIGKFQTHTKAAGWNLSGSLGGRKAPLSRDQSEPENGINQYGISVGRFWQFYKHFNEKIGVFAGPSINLSHTYTNDLLIDQNNTSEQKTHTTALSLGLSAGLYYRLSERLWVDASLGFSNPFSVGYTKIKNDYATSGQTSSVSRLTYNLTPAITFPSVGLGLRYFLAK